MVNIAIVHSSGDAHHGGTITFLRNVLTHLDSRRFRCLIVLLSGGELADELRAAGFEVVCVDARRLRNLFKTVRAIRTIYRVIRECGATLLLSNGPKEHIYGGIAALFAGIPAGWHCHAIMDRRSAIRWATSVIPAKAIFTHGECIFAQVQRVFAWPAKFVRYGIEIPPITDSRGEIRDGLGIPRNAPLVTMVGLMMRWKGQNVFIEAASRVLKQAPSAKFLIVGDRPPEEDKSYVASLENKIQRIGLEGAVLFTGFRRDIHEIMSASDIVVHASTSPEPFGLVILEGMVAMKPVIATAAGGPLEIVLPGETGLLVPPGDADAMARACIELLKDPLRRQRMGEAGRRRVETGFRVERMVRELEAAILECVPEKPEAPRVPVPAPTALAIIHASASANQGGTITFLRGMLGRLNGGTFRFVVIFLNGGPLAEEFRALGIPVITLNAGRVRDMVSAIAAVRKIRGVLQREKISLVLSNGPKEHIYGGLAARLARVPAVWYCHGLRADSPLIRWAGAAVPTRMILTHGEHTLAQVQKSYRAPARSIPIGIELPAGGSGGAGVRGEFGIGPEAPVVTIVGLLMRWKGQDVFLDAAAQIRACLPQARFLVVGDRPANGDAGYVADLRRQVGRLGLERAVTFTGFRHDVHAIMAASDVVVHASTSAEPFGIVLLEAMAASRPVVATALGGPLEIVVPGETGLLVPPGEPKPLAEAALFLLERPALRRAMGENGRQRLEALFTADRMSRELEAVFQECAGRIP